jgi:undecaprenyl-diphosphatase
MTLIQSIIIGIVEGLTEFLPVSSTGHMILANSVLGVKQDDFVKTFEISIQIGAILAIVTMYIRRFFKGIEIYKKLLVAFIPTGIVGFAAYHFIKGHLFNYYVVSISLIIGGIILILIDKKISSRTTKYEEIEKIPIRNSVWVGIIQCLSMIPGVSRAGATIVGGVYNGFDKRQATEFSFLLAVPTMFAASGYDLIKTPIHLDHQELLLMLAGFVTAFIFAWMAVKAFLAFITKYGFKYFGWYRILIGLLFLFLALGGIIQM